MDVSIGKQPNAWIPLLMSQGAPLLVARQFLTHGVEPERDEDSARSNNRLGRLIATR
jgi:hypothetical protein